jgi:two-component system nitrogen regulation response regulator GlnG
MLLRVLETGSYRPLGASQDARSTARLIAATDQDLDARGFNQPLLRRMEAFVIRVAPLRERREDIGLLLLNFLQEFAMGPEELAVIPVHFISEMCNADWPGNIRQLCNVARRALMTMRTGEMPALAKFVSPVTMMSAVAQAQVQPASAPVQAAAPRKKLAELDDAEVLEAMESNGWQISGAAQQLGISRPSLYKLIEAHPAIRPAALIPAEEISGALRAHAGDLASCASQLKTPSEALRRHLRVLGLDP